MDEATHLSNPSTTGLPTKGSRQHSGLYHFPPGEAVQSQSLRGELRLDVDGEYPQMLASGVLISGLEHQLHWVARLQTQEVVAAADPAVIAYWTGAIFYRDPTDAMPQYLAVHIAIHEPATTGATATVVFEDSGGPALKCSFEFVSASFDSAEFKFDSTDDAEPCLGIGTHDHRNHPANLPAEELTLVRVFERAGFDIKASTIPDHAALALSGADGRWSNTEMHDAMHKRFADIPQGALWIFHAALHESGVGLGGIMFDCIGAAQRQGTAVFTQSFISQAPTGDPDRVAWVARMRFVVACHETGHAFNLAHASEKSSNTPWMQLADDPEDRSFMNDDVRDVRHGEAAFFRTFRFRFSDPELQFLRHAPRRFVRTGNAAWFDHHGFEAASVLSRPRLVLSLRLNRAQPALEFLEPAMLEIKLKNVSTEPLQLPDDVLLDGTKLTLVVRRGMAASRRWQPYAAAYRMSSPKTLAPAESMYAPVFVGAALSGWLLAEPGRYRLQACLRLADGEDVVSPPLDVRVAPPRGREEEFLAQDVFTDDVGRVLAFDGTRVLDSANNTLREVLDRRPHLALGTHARVALGMPLRRSGKVLSIRNGVPCIDDVPGCVEDARRLLSQALLADCDSAAATLGHVEYLQYAENVARWLKHQGDTNAAHNVVSQVCKTLEMRQVKSTVLDKLRMV
ncbi:hypothetical protein [Ideonella sp. A 288]|uniref:hypothetical protein n=1 Tax=Ideonella sp. A 288 TaxID=1962181 RepID=UPI001185F03E|nr:hypothetical protein [Ideonella sp. A 288]